MAAEDDALARKYKKIMSYSSKQSINSVERRYKFHCHKYKNKKYNRKVKNGNVPFGIIHLRCSIFIFSKFLVSTDLHALYECPQILDKSMILL